MSQRDIGQPAADHFDVPRPSGPDGATYPNPGTYPDPASYPYPGYDPGEAAYTGPQARVAGAETRRADGRQPPRPAARPPGARPPGRGDGDQGKAPYQAASERVQFNVTAPQQAMPPGGSSYPWPPAPYPAGLRDAGPGAGERADDGGGRVPGGRRWLITAGIVAGTAAVGAAAVLLGGNHHGTQNADGLVGPTTGGSMPRIANSPPASRSGSPGAGTAAAAGNGAPLTLAQAQQVLAGYTAGNNSANAQRSGALLATVETGSSLVIDKGLYQSQAAQKLGSYPAFSPVKAAYYIPRNEPASGPRWFVVQVANAFSSSPANVASNEYLLFTQPATGGAWQDTIEPYLLSASGAPKVGVGADGLAEAVSPGAASDSVEPGQLPAVTARSLDQAAGGRAAVADPGNLADRADQQRWQAQAGSGTVTDAHATATGAVGQEFALLTADGGALVFYTDAAEVTVTARAGKALHLDVPGFYSPAQAITRAGVSYLEQFAIYDPPAKAGGAPRVIADYSAITGKNSGR